MTGTAGSVMLPPHWEQVQGNGNHAITTASGVWAVLPNMPTITVDQAGVYDVEFNVRGVVVVPAGAHTAYITAALYKNGVIMPSSEAMLIVNGRNNPLALGSVNIQTTGGLSFLHRFAAGDTVQVAAKRVGSAAAACTVASDANGRSWVKMHRIAR